jgi:hypothetical protein
MLFLGIDWGEAHHDLCLLDQDGRVLAARRVVDGLAGVEELHTLVAAQAEQPGQVAVGIETDRGCCRLAGRSGCSSGSCRTTSRWSWKPSMFAGARPAATTPGPAGNWASNRATSR